MKPSSADNLLAIAVAAGVAMWLVLQFTYAQLPPLPWTLAVTLGALAVGEALVAANIRASLRGRLQGSRMHPLLIARFAAFAKATTHTAAGLAGVFAGALVFVAPALSRGVGQQDAIVGGIALLSSLVLLGAGLFLEYACRVPDPPSGNDDNSAA